MGFYQLLGSCGQSTGTCANGAYYQGKQTSAKVVRSDGTTLTGGIRLVIPDWVYQQRAVKDWELYPDRMDLLWRYYTDFEFYDAEFVGSIWAPLSDIAARVKQEATPSFRPSRLLGKMVNFIGDTNRPAVSFQLEDPTIPPPEPIRLRSWVVD